MYSTTVLTSVSGLIIIILLIAAAFVVGTHVGARSAGWNLTGFRRMFFNALEEIHYVFPDSVDVRRLAAYLRVCIEKDEVPSGLQFARYFEGCDSPKESLAGSERFDNAFSITAVFDPSRAAGNVSVPDYDNKREFLQSDAHHEECAALCQSFVSTLTRGRPKV